MFFHNRWEIVFQNLWPSRNILTLILVYICSIFIFIWCGTNAMMQIVFTHWLEIRDLCMFLKLLSSHELYGSCRFFFARECSTFTFMQRSLNFKGTFWYHQFFQKIKEKFDLHNYLRSTSVRSLFVGIWRHQKDI